MWRLSIIPTVQLNLQYLMVTEICELANVILRWPVRSYSLSTDSPKLKQLEHGENAPSRLFTALLLYFYFEHLTGHTVLVDTFVDVRNM